VAIFDRSVSPQTQTYTGVNIYVNPGESYISPDAASIPSTTSTNFQIQLVTERGNLFQAAYPFTTTTGGGGGGITIQQVIQTSTEVITNYISKAQGDITGDYRSLQWATKSPTSRVTGFTWHTTWIVSRSDSLVWRFNVTNNGNEALTLNAYTSFQLLKVKTGDFTSFYIVYNSGTNANPTIVTYGGSNLVTLNPGETVTLYFAVGTPGANPSSGPAAVNINTVSECGAFLLIYDNNYQYAQNIPFIAINST
jgi:hypothetical protein